MDSFWNSITQDYLSSQSVITLRALARRANLDYEQMSPSDMMKALLDKKAELVAAEEAAAKAAAEEKEMANTRLLEEIRDLLKNRA